MNFNHHRGRRLRVEGRPESMRRSGMNTPIVAAFIAAVALVGFSPAQAMPIVPLDQAETAAITLVAGGCGAGMHRGPGGECRRNKGRVACGRGYRLTPNGCRPLRFSAAPSEQSI
jgi:uncharacterized membrane protein